MEASLPFPETLSGGLSSLGEEYEHGGACSSFLFLRGSHSKGHAADSQELPVGVGSPQFDHTIISVYVERVSLSVTQVFLELAMTL